MKHRFFRILLLIGFVAILYLGLAAVLNHRKVETLQSPDGTYLVTLRGQKERPLFFTAELSFDVTKGGQVLCPSSYLHSADAFDLSFEAGFPNREWPKENVLRFYDKRRFERHSASKLRVQNRTESKLECLKVFTSFDKILLFDLTPDLKLTFRLLPRKVQFLRFLLRAGHIRRGRHLPLKKMEMRQHCSSLLWIRKG